LQVILDTALPFFALIFCGYGAARFRLLSEASITGVNAFVFYFALPTFLFSLMATSPLSEIANAPFVAAYLGAGLPVFAVAAVLGRLIFKVRPSEAALQGSAAPPDPAPSSPLARLWPDNASPPV
jgi:malonate transporter and related proteins